MESVKPVFRTLQIVSEVLISNDNPSALLGWQLSALDLYEQFFPDPEILIVQLNC